MIKKLTSATSNIKKYLEDEDLLEDTLIETQQAIEMADIYGNILHSMTDTFASIISNNQNNIMKTLALVTIVMSIPTMIFSAYRMNFKDNELPPQWRTPCFLADYFHRLCPDRVSRRLPHP